MNDRDVIFNALMKARKGRRELTADELLAQPAFRTMAEQLAAVATVDPTDVTLTQLCDAVLRRAIIRLPVGDQVRAKVLFAHDPRYASLTLKDRYAVLAELEQVQPDSWKHDNEPAYLRGVADKVIVVFDDMLRGLSRRPVAAAVYDSRLGVDWLQRSEFYTHMEQAITAAATDIQAALRLHRAPESAVSRTTYSDLVHSSLYWLTYASALDYQFMREHGGEWLLSRPELSREATRTAYDVTYRLLPFRQIELSQLRLHLISSTQQEFADFLRRIAENQDGLALTTLWDNFIKSCHCPLPPGTIRSECRVHKLISRAEVLSDTIRSHWEDLIDWYVASDIRHLADVAHDMASALHPPSQP